MMRSPIPCARSTPAGKPRVHKTDVGGQLKAPPLRLVGFFDGYTRILAERPGEYEKKADVRAPPKITTTTAACAIRASPPPGRVRPRRSPRGITRENGRA